MSVPHRERPSQHLVSVKPPGAAPGSRPGDPPGRPVPPRLSPPPAQQEAGGARGPGGSGLPDWSLGHQSGEGGHVSPRLNMDGG